jgi:hypothetical protein
MSKVEEMLRENKIILDQIEIPAQMEERLRTRLRELPEARQRKSHLKIKIAVACILVLLVASQSKTMANYGRQLIGYDHIMSGTLKQLDQLGKGQTINRSFHFQNGVTVTLDAIMLDENQLLAFYTLKGSGVELDHFHTMGIKGKAVSYSPKNGTGEISNDGTEVKWVESFEPPNFYEKKLSFQFIWMSAGAGNKNETGEITFNLDRNQAMGHTLKKELNQSIKIGGHQIRLESILASPTTTVVKGVIQYPWELAWDQLRGERIRPKEVSMQLLANGKELVNQGGGLSTDANGIRFHHDYDALPEKLDKLQIQITGFLADHDVKETVDLNQDTAAKQIDISGQIIFLKNLKESNGDTYLTISSEDSVVLSSVQMIMDGKAIRLEETIDDKDNKNPDGSTEHERTLHFKGKGSKLQLYIEKMTYLEKCNEIINIPVD